MDLEGGTLAMASVQKILEIKSYIRLRITAEADLGLHISSEDTSYLELPLIIIINFSILQIRHFFQPENMVIFLIFE